MLLFFGLVQFIRNVDYGDKIMPTLLLKAVAKTRNKITFENVITGNFLFRIR